MVLSDTSGEQADELHHDGGADGETLVHLLALDDLFHSLGHQTFLAVGAVIGHDDDLIRAFAHFFFQDDQFLGASGQHGDDAVAGGFQCLHDGQHRCDTHAASGADHGAEAFDVCGLTQRTYYVGDAVALVQFAQACGRQTHFLHHEGDGPGHGVGLGDGEGHAFALLADADDDEVSGLSRPSYQWRFHYEFEYFFREMFFADNLVHVCI